MYVRIALIYYCTNLFHSQTAKIVNLSEVTAHFQANKSPQSVHVLYILYTESAIKEDIVESIIKHVSKNPTFNFVLAIEALFSNHNESDHECHINVHKLVEYFEDNFPNCLVIMGVCNDKSGTPALDACLDTIMNLKERCLHSTNTILTQY